MDDREDPIAQFFSDPENVDLYDVLSVGHDAKLEEIKKAYRRLALQCHPDKHTTASDSVRADASLKFQQIGFAYTVLSDEKKRQRYDRTGKTDEGVELSPGEDGWEAYFEDLFDRVTRGRLDEHKKEYQGSQGEVDDIKQAYVDTEGSIEEIMKLVPHSTFDDEPRFIVLITKLIKDKELPSLPLWERSVKDEKAKLVRKKQSQKEAKEAESLAKELGVWDEFYGSGKPSAKRDKGKGKDKQTKAEDAEDEEDEEDHSALQALILKKRKNMDGFFDSLAAKYAELPTKSKKGKKRGKPKDDEEVDEAMESPKKKPRRGTVEPPDIDEAEFEKLQQKLFGDKVKSGSSSTKAKNRGRGATSKRGG
ncbi:predicted protein [Postia placenta Mad-698-R]|uniref:J domain-containing protein n=1 Tax=Postia placenta MAD-698-R-SB12 TaxID=670580 RepID=A0A1X6N945_9APHY|nr:hypothetical protein POSPLADRAFT_1044453 [Postia placenta MAD-698-R-SB12]EED84185.1 predicted protein [Postia placenta Mad-698-R]OSX65032.1 hypothetical protein POSPLADRAFT_1044453 [Postia placenta MAD-698-R-SB12]